MLTLKKGNRELKRRFDTDVELVKGEGYTKG